MGFLYIPSSAILPQWFSTKRSLANGIAASGVGIGGLAYNLGAGAGIESVGPEWTYRILALCALASNLPCSLLLRDRNKVVAPKTKIFDVREYGHVSVLLVLAWGFLTELGYVVLFYSLPSYANTIGLSAQQGAVAGALLNLGLAIGRPVVGYCSDTFGRINVAAAMTALCGVLCLALWVPAKSYAMLIVFALLAGTVAGTFWGTVIPVTAEVVSMQRLPSVWGIICFSMVLPATFGQPIALQMAAVSGYLSSQIFVGCMFLAGGASLWVLRSWKIGDDEEGV